MSPNDTVGLGRRDLLRVGAGGMAAAAAGSATPAAAQEEFDYGNWFEDVPNFESTADRTGQDEVRVTVGPGGDLVFDPPAVHVDPGTTVVWEWGQGFHNVAEKETGERYASEITDESGTTYSVTFESDGISTYVCEPHRSQGMKGAVAVGSGEGTPDVSEGEMQVGGDGDGGTDGGGGDAGDNASGGGGNASGGGATEGAAPGIGGDVLTLFGVAIVLAFLSPVALVVLLYRQAQREAESAR